MKNKTFKIQFPITFTKRALLAIKTALKQVENNIDILRVSIKGGGCAGFQYLLNFVDEIDEFDLIKNINNVQISIDIFSSMHLEGTIVDYLDTPEGSGFKFNNPSARRTCGCGSSFS